MHHPGIHPLVRRLGVETPEVQQRRPGRRPDPGLPHPLNPPQAQPLPAVGDESPVGGPPLFPLGGEDVGVRPQTSSPPFRGGGGGTSPHRFFPGPGNSRCKPPRPLHHPQAHGLVQVDTPPRPPIPTAPPPTARGAPAPTKTGESIPDSPGRRGGGCPGLGGGGQPGQAGSHGRSWMAPAALDPINPLSHWLTPPPPPPAPPPPPSSPPPPPSRSPPPSRPARPPPPPRPSPSPPPPPTPSRSASPPDRTP